MRTLILLLSLACAAAAQDHVVEVGKLPYAFKVEAPGVGYVTLEFTDRPKSFNPRMVFGEERAWPIVEEQCEARVEGGTIDFVLSDRWGTVATEAIKFRVVFTPEDDPSEPNGDWEHARAVRIGETVSMRIRPAKDLDWLRVEVPEPGYLTAEFEGIKNTVEAGFYLDPTRELTTNLARIDVAGQVLVRVRERWGNPHPEPFRLTFRFEPETDPAEPNDRSEDAGPLELGEWMHARIAPAGDVDWFEVTVEDAGSFICEAEELKGFTPAWAAFRAGEREAAASGDVMNVQPGRYLLRLTERWGNVTPRNVLVRVRFVPEPDEASPNDDPKEPARIELGRWYAMAVSRPGDVDHVVFELPSPARVSIDFLGSVPRDFYVAFRAPDGSETRWGDGPRDLPAGTYPLVLQAKWGHWSETPFRFAVTASPGDDPVEPNDSPELATPLQVGTGIDIRLGPGSGDVDWYAVEIPGDGILYVITSEDSGWPKSCALVELRDPEGKEAGKLRMDPYGVNRFHPVTKGTWRLRVSPQQNRVPPLQTLRLTTALVIPSAEPSSTPGLLDIAVIGLDVDDSTMTALRAMASSGSASFANTTDLTQLEKQMRTIVETGKRDAERRNAPTPAGAEPPGTGSPWVRSVGGGVAGLIILLILVFVWRRSR
ncbi:MAG: hypothetical protein HUU15_00045 [Candidatus Brocadiae bacterium]|nr:hypothetical protein [Candidatus Brocadiia bacterium]